MMHPQPTDRHEPTDFEPYSHPTMHPHDNNRGYRSPQTVNKVFQSPEEITNNPGTKITGAIYDSGMYDGVPFNINGKYHY